MHSLHTISLHTHSITHSLHTPIMQSRKQSLHKHSLLTHVNTHTHAITSRTLTTCSHTHSTNYTCTLTHILTSYALSTHSRNIFTHSLLTPILISSRNLSLHKLSLHTFSLNFSFSFLFFFLSPPPLFPLFSPFPYIDCIFFIKSRF